MRARVLRGVEQVVKLPGPDLRPEVEHVVPTPVRALRHAPERGANVAGVGRRNVAAIANTSPYKICTRLSSNTDPVRGTQGQNMSVIKIHFYYKVCRLTAPIPLQVPSKGTLPLQVPSKGNLAVSNLPTKSFPFSEKTTFPPREGASLIFIPLRPVRSGDETFFESTSPGHTMEETGFESG